MIRAGNFNIGSENVNTVAAYRGLAGESRGFCRLLLAAGLVVVLCGPAGAWGPHSKITEAALEVLPDAARWKAAVGADNLAAMARYCLMPDQRGEDLGAFYADDFLLIRKVPQHVTHVMPGVRDAFAPYFRRALQASRTETPANAMRQLGPLVHFTEDVGAPPHAKPKCPHHKELENWVRAEQINIAGYRPQLLGRNDDEALAGLMRRIDGLVAFSAARAERALPLVSQASPDRAQVEPILLESALESARVTADVIYTMLTLGPAPQTEGACLVGNVTAASLSATDDHGARIVLLDTDYTTLAATTGRPAPGTWQGEYAFRNLPPGSYRVLAYRTGAQSRLSAPVRLDVGRATRLDIALTATDPPGNIVENPDARLAYLPNDVPDRWKRASPKGKPSPWVSAAARVKPKATYRCGAVLKDPEAKVSFRFQPRPGKDGNRGSAVVCPLNVDGKLRGELTTTLDDRRQSVVVQVQSSRPLAEAIERVWIVPAGRYGPATRSLGDFR